MKTRIWLFVALFFAGLTALLAETAVTIPAAASTGISPDSIVQWLTPIIVPLVIAGLKKVLPAIPSALLPIIAPILGVVIDLVNNLATAHQTNFLVAAALGLAGVGLREVKDQIVPAAKPPA